MHIVICPMKTFNDVIDECFQNADNHLLYLNITVNDSFAEVHHSVEGIPILGYGREGMRW